MYKINQYESILSNKGINVSDLLNDGYFWLPALYTYKAYLKNNGNDDIIFDMSSKDRELLSKTNRLIIYLKSV